MEEYNYVFIEMLPIKLYNLKNKGHIYETNNNKLVYCPNNMEHLNELNISDNYLIIMKKEKRNNILSEPNHIFIENSKEFIENHIIDTDWTCIWIEPADSEVYENYYTTIEAFNLAQKIENRFYNSISLASIYKNYYDWFYGFYDFPYHINKSIKNKVENRKQKEFTGEHTYFLPSFWDDELQTENNNQDVDWEHLDS
tara:strand:- start:6322 stop:6915 length:594 start_codon:yes stop_codon:yes gene_type:complete